MTLFWAVGLCRQQHQTLYYYYYYYYYLLLLSNNTEVLFAELIYVFIT